MTRPDLALHRFGDDRPDLPLLVLGPSLGTSVAALWGPCAEILSDRWQIIGWDLPGHGSSPPATGPFSLADLAGAVDLSVSASSDLRGRPGETIAYAGVSIGAAVGLQLCHDRPQRVSRATLFCTGARIGQADAWEARAEQVLNSGTAALDESSAERWFAPGFTDTDRQIVDELLKSLRNSDDRSYALACRALAAFDLRPRLSAIRTPLLAVAGSEDLVTPGESLREIAEGVGDGHFLMIQGVSHLAPAEDPVACAAAVERSWATANERSTQGMAERRAVLGDRHVDLAGRRNTEFTNDFQDFITRYAWGEIWTRPALSRRERSLMTITALVAGGHHQELSLHIRAAVRNGLSPQEISECLLHSAIYCGVPAANSAFRSAQETLEAMEQESAHTEEDS